MVTAQRVIFHLVESAKATNDNFHRKKNPFSHFDAKLRESISNDVMTKICFSFNSVLDLVKRAN